MIHDIDPVEVYGDVVQEDYQQESDGDVIKKSASEYSKLLLELIKQATIDRSVDVEIHVRRNNTMVDFKNFFQKPWNKRKQNCQYRITFIGESGVDAGGLSREFM